MRRYSVHEIFGPTIQGEGTLAGEVCAFLRLSGCNMWDGRPETRAASNCPFCDTDFFSHTMMTADEIVTELARVSQRAEWIWVSGGEPALQLDRELIDALHDADYLVAVESNGTREFSGDTRGGLDHLTISPKLPFGQTVIREADTLKLLWPHPNPAIRPEAYEDMVVKYRYLQPIDADGDTVANARNVQSAIEKLYQLQGWRLSLQMHKLVGVA
jgi:7-carboxy-7-deazaguanine synthase